MPTAVCDVPQEVLHVLKLIRRCFSTIESLEEKIRECLESRSVEDLGEKVDALAAGHAVGTTRIGVQKEAYSYSL